MEFHEVKYSRIHGVGCIAIQEIPKDTVIGPWVGTQKSQNNFRCLGQDSNGERWYEKGEYGRYCNHQKNCNTYYTEIGPNVMLVTNKDIKIGEEITVDYRWAYDIFGFYVDITGFIEH